MATWQLQEAKTHFSEVVKEAMNHGPQNITLRGKAAVVVISQADFDRLHKPKLSFIEFMRQSPLVGLELDVKRDTSLTRETDI